METECSIELINLNYPTSRNNCILNKHLLPAVSLYFCRITFRWKFLMLLVVAYFYSNTQIQTLMFSKKLTHEPSVATQKMKFSITDFFIKREIWSNSLKKSLMENFIFCPVNSPVIEDISVLPQYNHHPYNQDHHCLI